MSVTATGIDRIAAAFAGHGKRAALMPYLMGGYPDLEGSSRGRARRRGGRRRPDRARDPLLGSRSPTAR